MTKIIASLFIVNTNTPTTMIFLLKVLSRARNPYILFLSSSLISPLTTHVPLFVLVPPYFTEIIMYSLQLSIPPSMPSKFHGGTNYSVMQSTSNIKSSPSSMMTILIMNHSLIAFVTFHYLRRLLLIAVDSCIHTLRTNTERFLWHQRLGHPSDSYLYNAHKQIYRQRPKIQAF